MDIPLSKAPDSLIVLTAFSKWGEGCFSRFIGDWGLSLWCAKDHRIYLARDHAGARTLYFENAHGNLWWSTYLETFFSGGRKHSLDESYVGSYLGNQRLGDLTPYQGIRAVPPAHYLVLGEDSISIKPHWNWIAGKKLRYRTDSEYDEHFLTLFKQSVARRTGPGAPILAQLSGGMDSTSIVCMSDHIRTSMYPQAALIDTISLYDDNEPDWNERPYFAAVEATRGKIGLHLQGSVAEYAIGLPDPARSGYLFPNANSGTIRKDEELDQLLTPKGYRVILSGIGGDEVLGGIPSPFPELADHLLACDLRPFLQRALAWSLWHRKTLIHTLFETIKFTSALYRQPRIEKRIIPPWVRRRFRYAYRGFIGSSEPRIMPFRASPSAISNGRTWWAIVETLPNLCPSAGVRYEYRYPYLDRDLVDFLFRIPQEQLLLPGRRRALMRRALRDIVPIQVLERRRKAAASRGPIVCLREVQTQIESLLSDSVGAALGLIDRTQLKASYDLTIRNNDGEWSTSLIKAIGFEIWLRTNSRNLEVTTSGLGVAKFMHPKPGAGKFRAGQTTG